MDVLSRRLVRAAALALALATAAAAAASCKPDLDQRASHITGTRVLAVRSEPAEGEPRDALSLSALVVDGSGRADSAPPPTWAFCTARKPLAELGPVSPQCYARGAAGVFVPLGGGSRVSGALPSSACRDFGPEIPAAKPGETDGRPVDPDPTGGYYQPVSLFVDGTEADISVDTTRISCGVAGAPSDDLIAFRQRYHVNENPRLEALRIAGQDVASETTPVAVARGAHVSFQALWPACPAVDVCGDGICGPDETRVGCGADCGPTAVGCAGAERYVYFDPSARQLIVSRESMRVSWFASDGMFDRDRTGRASDDLAVTSDDDWLAPAQPTTVRGWVVLRDDRGGVAWRGFVLDVR